MLAAIIVSLLCNVVLAYEGESLDYYDLDKAEEYFEWFVKKHDKTYDDKFEEKRRLEIFKENLKNINERNAAEERTVFGINTFTDITKEEFKLQHSGVPFNKSSPFKLCKDFPFDLTFKDLPKNFDWRDREINSTVRNQRRCNSGWAFATADCDDTNFGCQGGNPWNALSYIISNPIPIDVFYPYNGRKGKCRYNPKKPKIQISGCYAGVVDEETMKLLLYLEGPLIVGLEPFELQLYRGGILRRCRCMNPDHAAMLVGYGEENGVPYWIIKNSYGINWGENGYLRLERGINACCIREAPISSAIF